MKIEITDIPVGHKIERINIEFSGNENVSIDSSVIVDATAKTQPIDSVDLSEAFPKPPVAPTPPPVRELSDRPIVEKKVREPRSVPDEMTDLKF